MKYDLDVGIVIRMLCGKKVRQGRGQSMHKCNWSISRSLYRDWLRDGRECQWAEDLTS